MADFTKAWQAGIWVRPATIGKPHGNPPFLKLARVLQCCWHPADRRITKVQEKGISTMFTTEISRKFATVACTILMSATCLFGALAPATASHTETPVAAATGPVA
ncbi:hypothetical protein NPJ82_06625 [Sphingomonas sp. NY01]|uniref:hypothetical protein n=1 Tax=Sphingomonas sp. NY01 TaxID=2968057 RepID=UPI00315D43F3